MAEPSPALNPAFSGEPGEFQPATPLLWWVMPFGAVVLLLAAAVTLHLDNAPRAPTVQYEQLTDFTDAAVAPSLSHDGRTVAFLRGPAFFSTGPIYVKPLPQGESRLVTNDRRAKYGLAFTPDDSAIAYTVFDQEGLDTYVVPVSGGPPRLFLRNAAGLTWPDRDHLLFSQARSGVHLGVVEKDLVTGAAQNLYLPAPLRGMAHYSWLSPDRRSLLVVEMDGTGSWAPCRLVSLTDTHLSQPIGPEGPCTAAAWSPDGHWMYFVATMGGQTHLWRQRFKDGPPQQLTFGAAEESGLAVDDNGTIFTSLGDTSEGLLFHDAQGDTALSSEGNVQGYPTLPLFRQGNTALYLLLRRSTGKPGAELWRASPQTATRQNVFPGVQMFDFDISRDAKEAVFTAPGPNGVTELWLAPVDHAYPPVRLGIQGARTPHFGATGQIIYQVADGSANFLEQIQRNGSGRSRLLAAPIGQFLGISPDGLWASVMIAGLPAAHHPTVFAFPLEGATQPRQLCTGFCLPQWSSDGRFLVLSLDVSSENTNGRSLAIPIAPGKMLPDLPAGGFDVAKDLPQGAIVLPRSDLIPGAGLSRFAFLHSAPHRNLFRLSLHEQSPRL